MLHIRDVHGQLAQGRTVTAEIGGRDATLTLTHELSERQRDLLRAGGVINRLRANAA